MEKLLFEQQKTGSLCLAGDTINNSEKIHGVEDTTHMTNRGVLFRLYKDLQISNKKSNEPIEKQTKISTGPSQNKIS